LPALDGISVVDLTRYLSGPTLTMLLADLGADVVKVETLPSGDPARQSGPFDEDESVYFMASNRNKRSLAVDLRSPEGIDVLRKLVCQADVFVQNFRPGTAAGMGLSYEELKEINPRLVYVSISGFGSGAAGSTLPGFDQTAQAMSGLMSVTGTEQSGPTRVGIALCDSATGVFGAVGVLAALYQRAQDGRGRLVETSLMESSLTLMSYQAQRVLSLADVPGPVGNDHPIMFPQGTFQTGRGAITLASGNEKMWRVLCAVLGIEELAEDARFIDNAARMVNRVELRAHIEGALASRTAEQWTATINEAGVPCSPVLDLEQALAHPVTTELSMIETVNHSELGSMKVLGLPVKVEGSVEGWLRLPPPVLGEHTRPVLEKLGYRPAEIDSMVDSGVVSTGRCVQ
jgi:crotonobetainyl-CoA:carnitine CoA-transferase CaiB-like acyl-CoA transferase